jgi:hypothetical protein
MSHSKPDLYVVTFDSDANQYVCSCGATCTPRDRKRFQSRHPKLCSERRAFSMRLAQGVRSVEDADRQERARGGKGQGGRAGLV